MSTEPAHGMSPFCNRSSIEIAGDVGAAVMRLVDVHPWVPSYLAGVILDAERGDIGDESRENLVSGLADLTDAAEELGRLFDQVTGWWIADLPPAINPAATSMVEAVLSESFFLLACFESPGASQFLSQCRLAEAIRHTNKKGASRPRLNHPDIEAALRCEISMMARRHDPDPRLWQMWAKVHSGIGPIRTKDIKSDARYEVIGLLPSGWLKANAAERESAITRMWEARPRPELEAEEAIGLSTPARQSDAPRWDQDARSLLYRGAIIRNYARRSASRQEIILSLLESAGWPRTAVAVTGMEKDTINHAVTDFNKKVQPGTIRLHIRGGQVTWRKVPGRARAR